MFYELSTAEMQRLGPSEVKRLFNEHQAGGSLADLGDDLAGDVCRRGEDDIEGNEAENISTGGVEGNEGNAEAVGEDIPM